MRRRNFRYRRLGCSPSDSRRSQFQERVVQLRHNNVRIDGEVAPPRRCLRAREETADQTTPSDYPKSKAAFASAPSIVGGRGLGSTAVVAGCAYGRRLARPRIVIVIADDADGADGIFRPTDSPWSQLGLHD